jgi:hypothetical protein
MMNEGEKKDLRVRTRDFALRIIRLYSSLPIGKIGEQRKSPGGCPGPLERDA